MEHHQSCGLQGMKKKSNIIIFAEEKYHICLVVLVNFSPQYFVDAAPIPLCCCLVDFEIFASNTKIKACLIFFS